MALVNTKKPNLVGGVSQQSDSLRFENQCTEQINADPSVIRGLQKRAPLEHVAELTDTSSQMIDLVTGPYKTFTHTINRDTQEQYIVSVSQKQNNHGYSDGFYRPEITVTHVDGTPQKVYWDPDIYKEITSNGISEGSRNQLLGYLAPIADIVGALPFSSIPPGEDEPEIKFASIADVTLILNTKEGCLRSSDVHPHGPPTASRIGDYSEFVADDMCHTVQIRQALFNQEYKIVVKWTDYNNVNRTETLIVNTPPSTSTGQTTTTDSSGDETVSTTVVDYNDSAHELSCEFIASSLAGNRLVADAETLFNYVNRLQNLAEKGVAVLQVGDCIYFYPGSMPANGPDGLPQTVTDTWVYSRPFTYTGPAQSISIEVYGPTSESMTLYKDDVDSFSKLSNKEIGARKVEVTTSPASEEDDYWVRWAEDHDQKLCALGDLPAIQTLGQYNGNDLVFKGRWKECGAPGTGKGIYKAYGMPLILLRQSDGNWLIKTAKGTTHSNCDAVSVGGTSLQSAYESPGDDYEIFNWKDRDAGDDDTNPHPTFVNTDNDQLFFSETNANTVHINAMTFHQNRLIFATDESVCMSESGDIWNFYRTTVTTLLDSDPIDVATTSSKISILRDMISYEDRLVLLSDQTQFIAYGNPVLSPSTISIAPITNFESSKLASPVSQGGSVFFPFKRGQSSGVREWFSNDASSQTFNTNDITAHIPQYIEGNITKIAASPQENVILCLTDANKDTIYCFNYFETGQGREQFAWSKYTFPGSIIHSVDFIAEKAYVLHSSKTGGAAATSVQYHANISSLDFQPNKTDAALGVQVKLDRRFSDADVVSRTYYPETNRTLIRFPYAFTLSDSFDIGTNPDNSVPPRNSYKIVSAVDGESAPALEGYLGRFIYVKGNWAADSPDVSRRTFFVGEDYEMSYTFSKPLFKPESGGRTTAIDGRHQLRYGSLMFSNSGSFNVEVTQADGTKYEHQFSGKILGSPDTVLGTMTLSTGDFRFPIFSESDSVEIKVTSNNPIGPRLESAEFEANYSTRNRRL